MNKLEEYKNLIKSLGEDNFKELVRIYLQSFYQTEEVNLVDGPWDGGNDACIYKSGQQIKRNIQITVQDQYISKLKLDLKKSSDNAEKFAYQRELHFFISHPISKSKQDELALMAELDFNISLRIFDANKIADDISRFTSVGDYLVKIFASHLTPKSSFKIDKRKKIIFDYIATGGNVAEIKSNFIDSYIQMYLFDNGRSVRSQIVEHVKSQLNIQSDDFIKDRIKHNTNKQFVTSDQDGFYSLTDEKRADIQKNLELAEATGNNLYYRINECLNQHEIYDEKLSADFLSTIIELYNSHYDSELDETTFSSNTDVRERRIYNELRNKILKATQNTQCDQIAKELLEISCLSEYLNKISASSLFLKLIKSNALENYISQFAKRLYVDTQILLQIICIKYKNVEYDDSLYNAVKYMLEVVSSLKGKISFYTTNSYIREAANHIWEAYNLRYFLDKDVVKSYGESKNIFYNFYLFLCQECICDFDSFEEYIYDLLNIDETLPNSKKNFIFTVENKLYDIFELMDFRIVDITKDQYDEYELYRREYDMCLDGLNSYKPDKARENDLLALLHLSDENIQINIDTQLVEEPYFVTWDSSFYTVRQTFKSKYKRSYWYLYTPYKIANRFSTITFKPNSAHITYEMLSLVESNFKASNDTISFVDTLSSICQPKNKSELESINWLLELRNQQQNDSSLEDFIGRNHKNLPIDIVLNSIVNHCYRCRNLDKLGMIFESTNYALKIKKIIDYGCKYLVKHNRLSSQIYSDINTLLG